MSNTHTSRRKSRSEAVAIAQRSAVPLFLFSLVLLTLLLVSQVYLLPSLTTVEVGGTQHNARELRSYHAQLLQDLRSAEEKRDTILLPMEESVYQELVERKHDQFPLLTLRSSLQQTARQLLPDTQDVVHIGTIRYLPDRQQAEMTGDVRNVGSRSMTVLAQLVEELRGQPFVKDVTNPRFRRLVSPDIGPYSPFTFRINLL